MSKDDFLKNNDDIEDDINMKKSKKQDSKISSQIKKNDEINRIIDNSQKGNNHEFNMSQQEKDEEINRILNTSQKGNNQDINILEAPQQDEVEIIFTNLNEEKIEEDEYQEIEIIEITPKKKDIKSKIQELKENYNINVAYEKEIALDSMITLGGGFIFATNLISKAVYKLADNLLKK